MHYDLQSLLQIGNQNFQEMQVGKIATISRDPYRLDFVLTRPKCVADEKNVVHAVMSVLNSWSTLRIRLVY